MIYWDERSIPRCGLRRTLNPFGVAYALAPSYSRARKMERGPTQITEWNMKNGLLDRA
jgi:hypothetical protein